MQVLDVFSGIGGFSFGLERAGMKTIAFCEIDPFRQAVLRKHWPHVPIFSDIRQLNKQTLKEAGVITDETGIDLICGGWPCQPFSIAGKRRGKADDRYLWPEMLRLIRELRPRWVLGENVAHYVNMALDDTLSDLEAEGYEARALVIPACAVGAPHRRDRVWIVAYSAGMERQSGAEEQRVFRGMYADGQECDNTGGSGKTQFQQNVAYATGKGLEGGFDQARQNTGCSRGELKSRLGGVLDGLSCRLDGYRWPAPFRSKQYEWEPPRVAQKKIPNRKERIAALGDSIVPQVAEVIGHAIMLTDTYLQGGVQQPCTSTNTTRL